jgi:hypothetical protein
MRLRMAMMSISARKTSVDKDNGTWGS